jgi:hypothetical protein
MFSLVANTSRRRMANGTPISSFRYLVFLVAAVATGFLVLFFTGSWVWAMRAGVIAGVVAGWVSDIMGWRRGDRLGTRASRNRDGSSGDDSRAQQ